MYHAFSVAETFRTAWNIFKRNFVTISVFSVIGFLIVIISGFIVYYFFDDGAVFGLGGFFILLTEISFIFLAFNKLVFRLIDKEYYDFDFSEVVPTIKMLASYLALLVLVSTLAVLVTHLIESFDKGYAKDIFGITIGIFVQFFFLFYFPICTCFIVDDASGPIESVVQSFHLIRGNFLKYLIIFIVIEALIFVGSLTILGILFVIPFVNIILIATYRKLVYSHQDVDDDLSETN
jgi:uncharacterized membrane protein